MEDPRRAQAEQEVLESMREGYAEPERIAAQAEYSSATDETVEQWAYRVKLEKLRTDAKNAVEIQASDGNWDYDPYMHGMFNGMELLLSMIEDREPAFRDAPPSWRRKDVSDFVEDLAKTGTRFDLHPTMQLVVDARNSVGYSAPAVLRYLKRMDDSIRERAREALMFKPKVADDDKQNT